MKKVDVCECTSKPCLVGTVESATSDLHNEGSIGESLVLEIFGVLWCHGQMAYVGD